MIIECSDVIFGIQTLSSRTGEDRDCWTVWLFAKHVLYLLFELLRPLLTRSEEDVSSLTVSLFTKKLETPNKKINLKLYWLIHFLGFLPSLKDRGIKVHNLKFW